MSQWALAALVVAITGVYAVRWTRRLSEAGGELPLKTTVATLLAGAIVVADVGGTALPPGVAAAATALAALFVFGPIALTAAARGGRYGLAAGLVRVLYWTPQGRAGLERLVAQVALRRGDLAVADSWIGDDAALLRLQWLAAQERWHEVLDPTRDPRRRSDVDAGADALHLADEARVRALLALDRTEEAEDEVRRLQQRAGEDGAGPIAARVAQLSAARLAAARGRVEEVQRTLQPPPPGVAPHELFEILAQAAERAAHPVAGEAWARAYAAAPPPLQERYAARLEAHGHARPTVRRARPIGTWAATGTLVGLYLLQRTLDGVAPPVGTPLGALTPAQAASAFLLGIQGVPGGEAWWRFLSYAFVHGNLVHIGLNAWVLFDIGRLYEGRRHWGDLLAAFTLGTGMGAYLTSVAQAGDTVVLVGASGGVLGVAGALLADVLRGRGAADRAMTRSLLQWMALITLLSVAVPGVSLWGHVGGVVGGALWGFARQGLPGGRRTSQAAAGLSIALLALAFVGAATVAASLL
jgi:rhomboid protease GluP